MTADRDPYDDAADAGRGVLRSTVYVLALGALLTSAWRAVQRSHVRRLDTKSRPVPEKLQTWEGEGGRPDPDPEAPPATPPVGL